MSAQRELDWGARERMLRRRQEVLDILREIVAVLGLKRLAHECGCSESRLAEAIGGREGRHVRIDWALIALEAAPDHLADALARALVGPRYSLERRRQLTPAEELERLRDALRRRVGPLADEIEKEALGR